MFHHSAEHPLYERVYAILASIFVVFLVLTNIVGIKLFRAPFNPEFALATGIITYPVTFLVTDVVSEIYGKKRADFMVFLGFGMSFLMLIIVQIAIAVPPHPYWVPAKNPFFGTEAEYQHAFNSVFALNGTLLVASMAAYMTAQLTDNFLFHFWRRVTKGKHLWLRNNGSTMVSQLLDTFVVGSILFYYGFGMDFATGLSIMMTVYFYKLGLAILDTPLIYLGVYILEKKLHLRPFAEES